MNPLSYGYQMISNLRLIVLDLACRPTEIIKNLPCQAVPEFKFNNPEIYSKFSHSSGIDGMRHCTFPQVLYCNQIIAHKGKQ
jgi:hypothetical protein